MSGIAAPAPRRLLLVTVHDVAPPFAVGVRHLLNELDRRAIRPRVLKVVPCYAGRWPLAADDALCRLLRTEVANGSEIVAHGWTHRAQGTLRGSVGARWRGAWLAGGAAEFLSLPAAAAHDAARSARRTLADTLGVEPQGFCAPAWLLNKEGREAVTAAGYEYLLEQTVVRDLRTDQAIATPWQGYMGVSGFHEWLVQLGNGAIAVGARLAGGGLARCPVVKVFLHPQQLEGSRALERVLDGLTALAAQREVVTASQLVSLRQQERTAWSPLVRGATPPAERPLPFVSVIVPALNEQSYIAQALRSVARQRYPLDRLECVVVDNGSRDATAAVVQEVARRWAAAPDTMPRVQLTEEPLRGTARAKNRGAAVARGDVLVFLDADSTLGPTVVAEVVAAWSDGARGGSIPVLAASDDLWERGFFSRAGVRQTALEHPLPDALRGPPALPPAGWLQSRSAPCGRPGLDAARRGVSVVPRGLAPAHWQYRPAVRQQRRCSHSHLTTAAACATVAAGDGLDVRALVIGLSGDWTALV